MSSTVLDVPTLETLIAASVAAPSIHNTQPWRFRGWTGHAQGTDSYVVGRFRVRVVGCSGVPGCMFHPLLTR